MEVFKDKALIVNTKRPEIIINSISKSKIVKTYDNGVTQVAVNWGLDEVIKLTSMKLKNVLLLVFYQRIDVPTV